MGYCSNRLNPHEKTRRVTGLARDLVEVVGAELLEQSQPTAAMRIAFHRPCTLQHAQKLAGAVEVLLARVGFDLTAVPDAHLCCGSAGTYSVTQPALSKILRDNKLDALESDNPEIVATANIGSQVHLAPAGRTTLYHGIELAEEALPQAV